MTTSLIGNERELCNCFSINHVVGQNIVYVKKQIETLSKHEFFCNCLESENRFLSLLEAYIDSE